MERITAANNLIIEYEPEHWRLLQNGGGAERVLVETAPDASLRYPGSFGVVYRLPETGVLDSSGVDRVVLGWSAKDQTWHLGLMLDETLAQARGSRWCGLARWNETEPNGATQAGKQLASQIRRPFLLVPPKTAPANSVAAASPAPARVSAPAVEAPVYQPAPQVVDAVPPPALPELPYELDDWRLDRAADGRLLFTLMTSSARRSLKALWYALWAVIFVVLSITSLTVNLAPPQPTVLPYIGIVGAVFLLGLAIYTLLRGRNIITRIEVDGVLGVITGFKGNGQAWQYPRNEIQGIYASQVVSKVNRRNHNRTVDYGELSLLLHSGEFEPVIIGVKFDEKITVEFATDDDVAALNADGVSPLTVYTAKNKVQAAALKVAEALNINAVDDRRIR